MNTKKQGLSLSSSSFQLSPRRASYHNALEIIRNWNFELDASYLKNFERLDLIYRTLCAILFNFVPTSGHPGGSISSGRIVEGLIYQTLDYDFTQPDSESADMLVYAAGHKAMGMYAMWALRNELLRIGKPELLSEASQQLRLEDLLGFRRNPTNDTPLFKKYHSKTLDGHPTPATPFVRIATGASGVGVPAALGLAMAALDTFGDDAPKLHIIEGEGGMTPGRVHEALAAAASAQLHNVILHLDWNQASIDSNRVCREAGSPGDYVQWEPAELFYCHDWNVIYVQDGRDFRQLFAAQKAAMLMETKQPTAIIYRTIKGWKYGIEGKGSHGAGHKFCSDGFYKACEDFEIEFKVKVPRFFGEATPENVERTYFETLMTIRDALEQNGTLAKFAAMQTVNSQQRLMMRNRAIRADAPKLSALYDKQIDIRPDSPPDALQVKPGDSVTLRSALGDALNVLNKKTGGAIIGSAADLLGSTSVSNINKGFPDGLFNAVSNPRSRLIAVGGICEDAMGAFMAGLSTFGRHIGVTSSYGAFIGALEHVAARLHGIGQQTKGEPYKTWIMINAHAGVKTGEDGPTHADPQVLQLLQGNFPKGVLITLTPWDAQEIWPLLVAGLQARPAVLAPFVTRPADIIVDRKKLGLPSALESIKGVYAIRRADPSAKQQSGTLVLQGNGVATVFVQEVLPKLDERGMNLNVFYISSAELFDRLSMSTQEQIFPEYLTHESMGITDFTLPTMYRWVRSNEGIRRTLHSFREGRYLGSGQAHKVLQEAGIHAEGQLQAILSYAQYREGAKRNGNGHVAAKVTIKTSSQTMERVRLICTKCGKAVAPADYFNLELPPNDEMCLECSHRDPLICANCLAYWMNENRGVKFYCDTCLQ
jgi:transketolase